MDQVPITMKMVKNMMDCFQTILFMDTGNISLLEVINMKGIGIKEKNLELVFQILVQETGTQVVFIKIHLMAMVNIYEKQIGTFEYKNGDVFKGKWKKGKKNGHGEMRYKDKRIVIGEWIDDEL